MGYGGGDPGRERWSVWLGMPVRGADGNTSVREEDGGGVGLPERRERRSAGAATSTWGMGRMALALRLISAGGGAAC